MGVKELLRRNHLRKRVVLSTVSGVLTTSADMIEFVDKSLPEIDIITTKSYQVERNPGNREPIICQVSEGDFGNSVGLKNPGMDEGFSSLSRLRDKGLNSYLNISISASSIEDFVTLSKRFAPIADILELNYSCPHAKKGYGASIGSDESAVFEFTKAIKEAIRDYDVLLIPKLTPNVPDIAKMALLCKEAGADGVAAINTVGPRLYIEKNSEKPILNNPPLFKGGASGEWIRDRALEAIREIRDAVGDDFIILGMGGVTDSSDVRAFMEAGADSVGIGSVFARLKMEDYRPYLESLKNSTDSRRYLISGNQMEYRPVRVRKKGIYGDLLYLEFDSSESVKAGEFLFLWIPGVGEKPFSAFTDDPFSLLIKKRGYFTEKCFSVEVGDTLYIRGPCGKPYRIKEDAPSTIIAGGSGLAVIPLIGGSLSGKAKIYIGVVEDYITSTEIYRILSAYGDVSIVKDNGKPCRVLDYISPPVSEDERVYIIGPEKMMYLTGSRLLSLGYKKENIVLSMEKSTRCGVGLCGECFESGKLTCKEGTFFEFGDLYD